MSLRGYVNGKRFNSGRKMVEMIYRSFYNNNPSITFADFINEVSHYGVEKMNDSNQRSFFKSENAYRRINSDLQKRIYDDIPFVLDGQNYYLKTETGEPQTSEHIRFAGDHGISVVLDNPLTPVVSVPTVAFSPVSELKKHNDALISFYIAETKSFLTKSQYDYLSNVEVIIDDTDIPYFEIVGRYDLREIINEIEELLERKGSVICDFRGLLEELLRILWKILELEGYLCDFPPVCQFGDNGEPFNIPNISFQHITKIRDLNSELKSLIEKLRKLLNEGQWSQETIKLIEDILNRIWPKIVGRKRTSTVLGTFTASQKRITLYKLAIENWLSDVDYFKKLLDVYSHELFHAFHYAHMKKTKQWEYDDKSRMVKESLARYIEYRYGMLYICETAISADLIRMWNDNDMCDFPYAGAKYVEKFSGLCELMFKDSVCNGTKRAFHLIDSASKL